MTVKPGWARKRPTAPRTLPATEKPEQALAPEWRPLWKLDRGEQRVLFITFAVLAANLIADFVYVFVDPRTRQEA